MPSIKSVVPGAVVAGLEDRLKNFNLFTARKCPECKSRNIRRSVTAAVIMEWDASSNKMIHRIDQTDAGHFECRNCGFEATP